VFFQLFVGSLYNKLPKPASNTDFVNSSDEGVKYLIHGNPA
jgi:hypothetical protein